MADRLRMHAQLVRTAGFRRQHKACSVALRIVGKRLVVRQRDLAIDRIDDVSRAVGPVNAKRQIDAAICRGGTALDEGDVTLSPSRSWNSRLRRRCISAPRARTRTPEVS